MASYAQVLIVLGGDSEFPIELDPLPPFEDEVMYIFEEERPRASQWTQVASALLRENRRADAQTFLASGIQHVNDERDRAHLRAMLATMSIGASRSAPKLKIPDARFQRIDDATKTKDAFLAEAARELDFVTRSGAGASVGARLARALLAASAGRNDEAARMFDEVLRMPHHSEHPIALLGKACCLLRRRAYAAALKIYQHVLRLSLAQNAQAEQAELNEGTQEADNALPASQLKWHRWAGPDPRVGLGLALWGLGRTADARRAWTRAAALDPTASAPALLLGLAALHQAKSLEAPPNSNVSGGGGEDEDATRSALYAQGMTYIQRAWTVDKNNSMTACALADHIVTRASVESATRGADWARAEYARALKLGEHAMQRADSRSAAAQAQLLFARAAHLASALDDGTVMGDTSVNGVDSLDLRGLAYRYYARAIESLARPGDVDVAPGQALAVMGMAQFQVARGEPLAAIAALDDLLGKSGARTSQTLEPALLLGALRASSHPGASAAEREADREKARPLLERTLRALEAARAAVRGARKLDELDADGEHHDEAKEEASVILARSPLGLERLSRRSLESIAALGEEPLAYVQLAELWHSASRPNLARAAAAYASALRVAQARDALDLSISEEARSELIVRLRNNIGALHALRGSETPSEELRKSIYSAATAHLQATLSSAREAETHLAVPVAGFLDAEKTTALYNLGRVLEMAGQSDEAAQAYDAVLRTHVEYVDAKVRLALLRVGTPGARGDKEATQAGNALLKEALASDPSNLDTRMTYVCFLAGELPGSPSPPQWDAIKETIGQLFLGTQSGGPALFGGAAAAQAVQHASRQDPYIFSALGWTYYHLGQLVKPGPNQRKERNRVMHRAVDLFDKALSADPACAFAAHALAIVAAEGTIHELAGVPEGDSRKRSGADVAMSLLSRVKDVRDDGSVQVCMGHALMMRDDFEGAFKAYDGAYHRMRTAGASLVSILQYLARALYALGLKRRSYKHLADSLFRLDEALDLLALRRLPSLSSESNYIRYNIAVTRQKALQMLFELAPEVRTLSQLEEATTAVKDAQAIFMELLPEAKANRLFYITAEVVEQRHSYGETSLLRSATQYIEAQRAFEASVRASKEEVAQRKRLLEEEREVERKRRAEAEAARAAELAAQRAQARQDVQQWQPIVLEEEKPKPTKRSGGGGGRSRKSKKNGAADSEIETSEEEREYGGPQEETEEEPEEELDEEAKAARERRKNDRKARKDEIKRLKEKRAGKSGAKKSRKSRAADDEAGENSDDGPVRKKKRGLRLARDEDLIESDEEV